MVTRIPTVNVTRIEAQAGFVVTCTSCPRVRTMFGNRPAADAFAAKHRRSHQTPEPDDGWL